MSEDTIRIEEEISVDNPTEKIQYCLNTIDQNPPTEEQFQEKVCGVTIEELVGALISAEERIRELEYMTGERP